MCFSFAMRARAARQRRAAAATRDGAVGHTVSLLHQITLLLSTATLSAFTIDPGTSVPPFATFWAAGHLHFRLHPSVHRLEEASDGIADAIMVVVLLSSLLTVGSVISEHAERLKASSTLIGCVGGTCNAKVQSNAGSDLLIR